MMAAKTAPRAPRGSPPPQVPDGKTLSTGEDHESSPSANKRKTWIRRTPVEVVLDQIHKQEERVAALQEELTREKRELEKLQKAKEVLEAK